MRTEYGRFWASAILLGTLVASVLGIRRLAVDEGAPATSALQQRVAGPEGGGMDRYFPASLSEVAATRHRLLEAGDPAFEPSSPSTPNLRWAQVGPLGIREPTVGYYYSGRIISIAADTQSSSILYAGSARGGIWRTRDGGASWRAVFATIPNPAIGAIAVNPADRTVWAGTGEFSGGVGAPGTSFSVRGTYLYKSENFGGGWWRVDNFPFIDDGSVTRIAFDSRHPEHIYVATDGGLYKSEDGGDSFDLIRDGVISDVLVRPRAGLSQVLCADMSVPGVFMSQDDGESFRPTSLPGAVASQLGRMQLASCASQPDIVYVSVSTPGGAGYGLWRTANFGIRWYQRTLPGGCCGGQGSYDQALGVSPTDRDRVYLGWIDRTSFVSIDGARSWNRSNGIHEDLHNFAFDPNDANTVYHVSDGGVFKSTDGGVTWGNMGGHSINAHQVYYVTPDPKDPAAEWIGTQDDGVARGHTDTGEFSGVTCCDGGDIAFAGNNAYVTLTGLGGGALPFTIQTSPLGGAYSWSAFTQGLTPVGSFPPMTITYNGTNFYTFAGAQVYRTNGTALPWGNLSGPGFSINTIAVASNGVVYAGGNSSAGATLKVRSTQVWTTPALAPRPDRNVIGFGIGSTCGTAQTAYVCLSGIDGARIYRSDDTGSTWNDATGNLPYGVNVSCLLVDPLDDDIVYAGTDLGIYNSEDGGDRWLKVSRGLPTISFVTALAWRPELDRLLIGTYGRGVWQATVKKSPVADLSGWWSGGYGDNFATRDLNWRGCAGATRSPDYGWVRVEGRLFTTGSNSGTLPLYHWFSPGRQDNYVTTDPAWAGSTGSTHTPDYQFVRTEGFIYSPDQTPPADSLGLYTWYSPSRGDYFTTSHPTWVGRPGDTRSPDYVCQRVEGYLLPTD